MNQQILLNRLEWEGRWFLGEPELSRTVVRAAFANWLSQCDKPPFERLPQGDWGLFANAPAPTTGTATIAPDAIGRLIRRSLVARPVICPQRCVFNALDTESAWQALLELLLATQIHCRETVGFPESAEELVGHAVDVLPVDPFGRDPAGHGAPLRYRREAGPADGVTLWSIGPDGIDDDGRLKYPASVGHDSERGDVLISIKPPRK